MPIPVLETAPAGVSPPVHASPNAEVRPCARIAVDLTGMLPGGTVGGAKVLALDLIRRIRQLAPHYELLILTSAVNDAEVAEVAGGATTRLQVLPDGSLPRIDTSRRAGRLRWLAGRWNGRQGRLMKAMRRLDPAPGLCDLGVDVLFCPFTTSRYAEGGLRVVSLVYDLQHVDYPQFFTPQEVAGRNAQLAWLRRWADRIICVSDHARQRFLRELGIPPARARVAPCAIHDRLRTFDEAHVREIRARLGLARDYVLYPANAWPHKNHRLLLAAFGLVRARRPDLDVDLVLTGTLVSGGDELKRFAAALGLGARVHWTGHCADLDLAALYESCRMVVFPSLYEGFGIPLLEAMSFGRPVACSAVTSLPEVGGDAVRYFDPRRPEEIAGAMLAVLDDPGLASELAERGRRRVEAFSGDAMAAEYVAVFDEVLRQPPRARDAVTGIFDDGWTGASIGLAHTGGRGRMVEIDLEVPAWCPSRGMKVYLERVSHWWPRRWTLVRGTRRLLRVNLPAEPGHLSFALTPLFRPSDHGMGDDGRLLGCLCRSVRIHDRNGAGPNLL
jgi:glycosyltransferase involved in cell wall biosynthesis